MTGPMWAIATKDLRLLLRDTAGLFWVAGFPFVMAIFFGIVFGGGGGRRGELTVLVVDEDRSAWSAAFAKDLDASDVVRTVEVATLAEAENRVATGKAAALVRIRQGAGEQFLPIGADSAVELGIDPARRMEAQLLQGLVLEATFRSLRERFLDRPFAIGQLDEALAGLPQDDADPGAPALRIMLRSIRDFLGSASDEFLSQGLGALSGDGAGGALLNLPVREISRVETGPRTGFEVTFPSGIMWAFVGVCAGWAITLVRERREGTLARLRMAPVSRGAVLAGKALGCALACAGAATLLLLVGHFGFRVRIVNVPALAIGVLAAAACFTGIMMFLSTLGETEAATSGAAWGVMMGMMLLGGGMIPLFAMPAWLAAAASISPVKWAVLAIEGAVWRGSTWGELLPVWGALLVAGSVAFAAGVWRLKGKD